MCAKSHTGFMISVSDCPMVCISTLQTEMALATMEVEIIALAHCCHELFPVMDIMSEVGNVVGLVRNDMVLIHVLIHKDNA